MTRSLYLHEVIDIVGTGTWPYMEHTLGASGDEKVNFELVGTFATMGITGRWPQVVNLWEVPGGWDGWREAVRRLNLERPANRALEGWWLEALKHRSGGIDRLLAGAPGCPTKADLVTSGTRGSLFVHEMAQVAPGGAGDYLAAVCDQLAPVLADHGHTLVGLYENVFDSSEAIVVWATDVDSHVGRWMADDAARGFGEAQADPRLLEWRRIRDSLVLRSREELMTPYPGIAVGPPREEAGGREGESG